MGIFDRAKDLLAEHNDKVDSGIDKAAGLVNEKTGGQHADQVSNASGRIKQGLDDIAGTPGEPGIPAEPGASAEPITPAEPTAPRNS